MERTDKKQNIPNGDPTGKKWQQAVGEEKTLDNKAWWEQLAGAMPNDKESVKNWYSLLSNPLIIIFGVLILGYWLVTQKRETATHINANKNVDKEKEELNVEIKRLKKKYKKVKKRIRTPIDNKMTRQRFTLLD